MPVALWVKRVDNGNYQDGDVIDMKEGQDMFYGKKPTQSGDWRIVLVTDACPEQIYALGLFASYKHPATNRPILQRVAKIDIFGLEAHTERVRKCRLANDDVIRTGIMQVEMFTVRKFLPPAPGIMA